MKNWYDFLDNADKLIESQAWGNMKIIFLSAMFLAALITVFYFSIRKIDDEITKEFKDIEDWVNSGKENS